MTSTDEFEGESAARLPGTCVVYGAGSFGRGLAEALSANGVVVEALLDRNVTGEGIRHPENATTLRDTPVILGLCNPTTDLREVAASLTHLGYGDVRSPVQAAIALGRSGATLEHYWLTSDVALYEREASAIAAARSLFADETSRDVFDAVLTYRRRGDLARLPTPSPAAEQYAPADLPFLGGAVHLVDGGAFDGDTIRALLAAEVDLASVVAFEPDPVNFRRLVETLPERLERAIVLPLGLGSGFAFVSFGGSGTSAAASSTAGDSTVQVVALDDVAGHWPATHVKLDIEGAELDALAGMRRLISERRPHLALCVYHEPDHLWRIPLAVAELDLGYSLHLRTYAEQGFETVLYAIPRR